MRQRAAAYSLMRGRTKLNLKNHNAMPGPGQFKIYEGGRGEKNTTEQEGAVRGVHAYTILTRRQHPKDMDTKKQH